MDAQRNSPLNTRQMLPDGHHGDIGQRADKISRLIAPQYKNLVLPAASRGTLITKSPQDNVGVVIKKTRLATTAPSCSFPQSMLRLSHLQKASVSTGGVSIFAGVRAGTMPKSGKDKRAAAQRVEGGMKIVTFSTPYRPNHSPRENRLMVTVSSTWNVPVESDGLRRSPEKAPSVRTRRKKEYR